MSEISRQKALDDLRVLDTPPEARYDRVTRLAKQLFGVETAAISLIDHDRIWFKSRTDSVPTDGQRSNAFCDFTIRKSEVFDVSDASLDPRFAENPNVLGDPNVRFYAGYPIETPSGEHVGALCVFDPNPRTFSEHEKDLLKDLALLVQKEMMIEAEVGRAMQVQQGLLPKEHVGLHGYESAGGCVNARVVGGDFYDWYDVEEGEAFTLVDVMGKGIGAAIIAATIRAVLRSGSRNSDLIAALEVAANTLESDLNNLGSFATLFHARLNTETGWVRYVDAGHGLSLLLAVDGTTRRLKSENPPLGTQVASKWEEGSFYLAPGDTLVSVSDGVLDLFDGTLASLDSVERIVRGAKSPQDAVNTLLSLVGKSASDDVTILIVHRKLH